MVCHALQANVKVDDHLKYAEENHQVLLDRASGNDEVTSWSLHKKYSSGESLYRGVVKGNKWNCLKAVYNVEAPAQLIAEVVSDPKLLTKYDKNLDKVYVLDATADGAVSVRYLQAKAIFPTSAREFLVVTSQRELNGIITVASRSIDVDEIPQGRGYVRAENFVSGFILEPISPTSCKMTVICHMGLGGYIPASIITTIAVNGSLQVMRNIKHLAEETYDESTNQDMKYEKKMVNVNTCETKLIVG